MTSTLISRLYITSWLMLGSIAIGYFYYLYHISGNPEMTRSQTPPAAQPLSAEKKSAASTVSALKAKVRENTSSGQPRSGLSGAIANMRSEMDRLKISLKTMGKENAALKEHVKNLEAAFGPATASIPKADEEPKAEKNKAEAVMRAAPQPKINVAMKPMPVNGFALVAIPPAPLPIAGPRVPTRTQFAIELEKALTLEKAALRWRALKKLHAGILGRLHPRTVAIAAKGPREKTVTLIAGPYNNAASAALACARLIAAGTQCKSTLYAGTPMANIASR